eukprot:scaffold294199_cov18-Tisochrysis_lutea.AAC.1
MLVWRNNGYVQADTVVPLEDLKKTKSSAFGFRSTKCRSSISPAASKPLPPVRTAVSLQQQERVGSSSKSKAGSRCTRKDAGSCIQSLQFAGGLVRRTATPSRLSSCMPAPMLLESMLVRSTQGEMGGFGSDILRMKLMLANVKVVLLHDRPHAAMRARWFEADKEKKESC